jgi:hypothetical protein
MGRERATEGLLCRGGWGGGTGSPKRNQPGGHWAGEPGVGKADWCHRLGPVESMKSYDLGKVDKG